MLPHIIYLPSGYGPNRIVNPLRSDKAPSTVILHERFAGRRPRALPDAEESFSDLEAGTRLGRYLIICQIGGGGMGHVYKAHDTELNRTVALKVLPPHLCRQTDYVSRFRAEAQAQARLNNPHVITLYSFMELPAGEVLVMEHVEGQTLAQRLRAQGPIPADEAVRLFDQVLRGVEHMHDMGVVHRDLKPSNIFLTTDGLVKLMDFGVAKVMDHHDPSQARTMVGTLLYISPEQINGRETDFRSDIYTLGVTLFETVTGRLPFERKSDYALMHAHVQETPPRPKQYQRRLPPALERVILKAIEKEPAQRFQGASQFRTALLGLGVLERRQPGRGTQISNDRMPDTAPTSNKIPFFRRQRWRGFGLDGVLIAVVAVLAFTLGLLPMKQPASPAPEAGPAVQSPARPAVKRALKPTPARAMTTPENTAAADTKPAQPPRDKYESLRQAWGD
jgi:serine/threonine-protein kinase